MTTYDPGRFSSTFAAQSGDALWAFLCQPENILRMETATYLGRPAIEPLSPFLLEAFGDHVRTDRIKQMLGHMVRQIMELRGYRLDQGNVKITRSGNIFTVASRYAAHDSGDFK